MLLPLETALAFVAAINNADPAALRALMTDDHTFTDALAHSFSGAETMHTGWQHFFHAYPNYRITLTQTFADGNKVALFGKAEGGWRVDDKILPQKWSVPAAWLAEIHDQKVRHWSVFCDTAWATPPKS
jgi:ketosteroid isomerase-like protein